MRPRHLFLASGRYLICTDCSSTSRAVLIGDGQRHIHRQRNCSFWHKQRKRCNNETIIWIDRRVCVGWIISDHNNNLVRTPISASADASRLQRDRHCQYRHHSTHCLDKTVLPRGEQHQHSRWSELDHLTSDRRGHTRLFCQRDRVGGAGKHLRAGYTHSTHYVYHRQRSQPGSLRVG